MLVTEKLKYKKLDVTRRGTLISYQECKLKGIINEYVCFMATLLLLY